MKKYRQVSRREFIGAGISGAAAALFAAGRADAQRGTSPSELLLYVGTYTADGKSDGIYVCAFDQAKGALSLLGSVKVADPSYLTISADGGFLFAVNELVEFEGERTGTVSAFAIDARSGGLAFLNKRSSRGGAPCYITATKDRRFVLVANYVGGSVACFPADRDGNLGESVSFVANEGSGPNKDRQLAPHAHSIVLDRAERFAFAADLGTDRIDIFGFDAATGALRPNKVQPSYRTKPGAGPRHFEFHPDGRFAFVINELDLTISSLRYDETAGTLTEIQTVPALPRGDKSTGNSGADIHVSPDGKFLYGSIRGHDSIVIHRIRPDGMIDYVGHAPTLGRKPRNFAIAPNGRFLLAANQSSGNIVVFGIDPRNGKLTPTGVTAQVPSPVCLKFTPRAL
jgi:6-phosphogluconolactonase